MEKERKLTITQASERLGVTPAALRQAIVRGTLHAEKIGPIYLVSDKEADRYKKQAKPGRPRTRPAPDPNAPKQGPGRPKKKESPSATL